MLFVINMKKLLFFLFFSHVVIISFSQTEGKTVSTTPVILKNFVLNEKKLISGALIAKSKELTKAQLVSFALNKMDEVYSPGNVYRLIDTLHRSAGNFIVLLGRVSENENIVWMASYNAGKKLVDFKQVYYDNAEGFLLVETVIKNNIVSITTTNDYEDSNNVKSEHYRFNNECKLEKVK